MIPPEKVRHSAPQRLRPILDTSNSNEYYSYYYNRSSDLIDVPRIEFASLPEQLQRELDSKFKRLGYLGEFFQICAHQPDALFHFNRFTETLKSALPFNLVELIALTVSTWSGNAYEQVQHERLSLKLGLQAEWIREVEKLAPDTANLSELEKAVQRVALAMAKTQGRDAHEPAKQLLQLSDAQTLIGILMTVGRYLAHAAIANTMQLAAPVASPLEKGA
jgi:alkylhydroperoxidase family enzyme